MWQTYVLDAWKQIVTWRGPQVLNGLEGTVLKHAAARRFASSELLLGCHRLSSASKESTSSGRGSKKAPRSPTGCQACCSGRQQNQHAAFLYNHHHKNNKNNNTNNKTTRTTQTTRTKRTKQTSKQTNVQANEQTNEQPSKPANKPTKINTPFNKRTNKWTNKQANKQTNTQTNNNHNHIHNYNHNNIN